MSADAKKVFERCAPEGHRLIEAFPYHDKDGKPVQFSARYEPVVADGKRTKTFRQFHAGKNGEVIAKAMPGKRPLYNLPELLASPDKPVLIVEGEGKANRAGERFADFTVTTSIGGSAGAEGTDWAALAGRVAVAWPDHDKAGDRYVAAVRKHVPQLKVVKIPETWPAKWDLGDDLPMGVTDDDLRKMIASAVNGAATSVSADEAKVLPRTTGSGNGKGPISQNAKRQKAADKALADKYCNTDGSPLTEAQIKAKVANLDKIAYDRERRALAEAAGVRRETLDDIRARAIADRVAEATAAAGAIEAWPEEVDGDALLDEIAAAAGRFLSMPEGGCEVLGLWAVYAHCFDAFDTAVMLAFLSPTPEAGKTRCLGILKALTPRPLLASNISPAALYRIIERTKPTFLVDELDTYIWDKGEAGGALRGVLNSGHDKEAAFVFRCAGGDSVEPEAYSTWCAKALAGIGKLPATLASRSIVLNMKRKLGSDTREKWRPSKAAPMFEPLRQQAARWAKDNAGALKQAEPAIPPALYGREEDKWLPLLAIADAAGGRWPERAREIAVLFGGRRDETAGVELLRAIREIFAGLGENADRIKSEDLAADLAEREGEPWPEFRNGKPITQNQVARLLAPFGIQPKKIRQGISTARGYLREWFEDAFTRYLPPQGGI